MSWFQGAEAYCRDRQVNQSGPQSGQHDIRFIEWWAEPLVKTSGS